MAWDRTAPTNPKYRTAEHRREKAKWAAVMQRQGYLVCAQPVCLEPSRIIARGGGWHLGHDDLGSTYIGPTHVRCNVVDGAKRGNARSRGGVTAATVDRWEL